MKKSIESKVVTLHYTRKEDIRTAEIAVDGVKIAEAVTDDRMDDETMTSFEILAKRLYEKVRGEWNGFSLKNIHSAVSWASLNSDDCVVFVK